MVFTIHRYIFKDLLKAFTLSTLVLSFVLGLGFMLRPLRDFSVDPARVPELLLCTFPITLTMVLPISALLAATLVYGRLAVDNEVTACRSSGISLPTLIYPAFTLALLVGMATLLLGFHVVPHFIARFETIIKTDAESIVYRNIEKKGNLGDLFPKVQIYADFADPEKHMLAGVAMVRRSKEGFEEIFTAKYVKMDFKTNENRNEIVLQLQDAQSIFKNGTMELGNVSISMDMPSLFSDQIKFKKLEQLKAIQKDPTLFSEIRKQYEQVQREVLGERFLGWVNQTLQKKGSIDLVYRGQHRVRIFATGCSVKDSKDTRVTGPLKAGKDQEGKDKAVLIEYYNRPGDKEPEKIYEAEGADLTVMMRQGGVPTATLELEKATLTHVKLDKTYKGSSQKSRLLTYSLTMLDVPKQFVTGAESLELGDLLNESTPLVSGEPSSHLVKMLKKLSYNCAALLAEIKAELHSRLAIGVSCVVLVLMGAALGIVFKSGHLLTAFGLSLIPAAICLITIFTGQHIAEQNPFDIQTGILFLWSGIVIVFCADFIVYKFVMKH